MSTPHIPLDLYIRHRGIGMKSAANVAQSFRKNKHYRIFSQPPPTQIAHIIYRRDEYNATQGFHATVQRTVTKRDVT